MIAHPLKLGNFPLPSARKCVPCAAMNIGNNWFFRTRYFGRATVT